MKALSIFVELNISQTLAMVLRIPPPRAGRAVPFREGLIRSLVVGQ